MGHSECGTWAHGKLLEEGYMEDYIGTTIGDIKGDTRGIVKGGASLQDSNLPYSFWDTQMTPKMQHG